MARPESRLSSQLYPSLHSSPDVQLEHLLEPPSKTVQYQEINPTLKEVKKCLKENVDSMTKDIVSKLDGDPGDSIPIARVKKGRDDVLHIESVEDEGEGRGERDQVKIFEPGESGTDEIQQISKKEPKHSVVSARDVKVEVEGSGRLDTLLMRKSIKTRGLLTERPTLHSRSGFRRYVYRDNSVKKQGNKVKSFIKNILYFCDFSRYPLKKIEGSFGSSVASYFVLLKHLIMMNFFIMLVQGLFVITPQLTAENPQSYSLNSTDEEISDCMRETGRSDFVCVMERFVVALFTGEGWFTDTPLFIGHYTSTYINPVTNSTSSGYHMPSAFIYSYITVLLLVTVMLAYWVGDSVLLTFTGLKQETGFRFAAIIFSSWDYNITKRFSARRRLKTNLINLIELHHEYTEQKDTRSWSLLLIIYLWRVFTWLVTILLLLSGSFLIVISPLCSVLNIINEQCAHTESYRSILTPVIVLLVQAVLDFIFPLITKVEFYNSHSVEVFVSLCRIVLVRVFSILGISIELLSTYIRSSNGPCWETEYGQEFYRQTLFALIASIFIYAVYLALRRIVSWLVLKEIHSWEWLPRKAMRGLDYLIDGPSFNIPTRVMNIIYIQALIWLGIFFCPWLAFLGFFGFLLLFFMMLCATLAFVKFDVSSVYFSAKSFLFYNFILILMFGYTTVLLVWPLFGFKPSSDCSPFRGQNPAIYSLITSQLSYLANVSSVSIHLGMNISDPNPVQWLPADLVNSPLVIPVFSILLIIIVGLARTLSRKNNEIDHLNKRLYEETVDKVYFLSVATKMGNKYFLKQN